MTENKVYIPYYERGWKILSVYPKDCKIRQRVIDSGYDVIYFNTIYNGNCFKSAEAAAAFVNKDFARAEKEFIYPNEIESVFSC